MKIFWITNILFPEAEQLLISSVELKASGGMDAGGLPKLCRSIIMWSYILQL